MGDPYNLQRFVDAQAPVFDAVRAELSAGRKEGHWMWFIFPQIAGLGSSPMSRRFAISSVKEAEAYLEHPVLGPRLRQCTDWVLAVEGRSVEEIFYSPDDLKFHSCMTLFAKASPDAQIFKDALGKYFDGAENRQTVERL